MANAHTVVVDHSRDRARWRTPARRGPRPGGSGASALKSIEDFGPNPGALSMLAYAPDDLPDGAPLVVVLHGCSQNAAGYDAASGWSRLAGELGFAVVFPEQRSANNAGGCFNWFLTADAARGLGETRSIREMVEHMVKSHRIDRGRIYVTGLSAGGAMAATLLADYPETFAAGAVIAGLPCGSATSVQEAFRAMSEPAEKSPAELGDQVRTASPGDGPWPRVLVMHGSRDATVSPKNGDALVEQWLNVHGAAPDDFQESAIGRHRRRVWTAGGRPVVESIQIEGMGHGAPLDGALGERKAPFMLDVGLSSTRRIADFFGVKGALDVKPAAAAAPAETAPINSPSAAQDATDRNAERDDGARTWGSFSKRDIVGAISKALKSAGLMK
ncbi:PHB depolymerase family esterase [Methylopila sp. M107]|uniref:extracellular catalytic domain type 1 short-chain-length polyhydroxyalkanoate depolymerase n=1 Tax=Methylopila sp. M107 TaxID=1101190 RepID=UPI00036C7D4A|nr:PHB depolymerase family esterase [Methylopila sp. M107]